MSNTTRNKILAIAPELSSILYSAEDPDNLWNIILADVALQISLVPYGNYQEKAQRYLAAHLLTLSNPSGAGCIPLSSGPVTSLKTGDEAITFGPASKNNDQYDSTSYGREFKKILSMVEMGFNTYIPGSI